MKRVLAEKDISQVELAQMTGLGRGTIGDIYRGQVARPAQEHVAAIAKALNIAEAVMLEAIGYKVGVRPDERIDRDLERVWPTLPAEVKRGLVALALAAANPTAPGQGAPR